MCIVIALEPKKIVPNENEITKKCLKTCWDNNPHGAGFMYVKDGAVRIQKFMNFKTFYRKFQNQRYTNQDSRFGIHFRIASVGDISIENCHPFWIRKHKTAMMHNGTITDLKDVKDKECDSSKFSKMLEILPANWMENPALVTLLTSYVGNNRILVLDKNNTFWFFNQKMFDRTNKYVWFSNDSYKPKIKNINQTCSTLNQSCSNDSGNTNKLLKEIIDKAKSNKVKVKTLSCMKRCSKCDFPLFYEQDYIVNKCANCWTDKDKKTIKQALKPVTCSLCTTIIEPDDMMHWVTQMCSKCKDKFLKQFQAKRRIILGQKILEFNGIVEKGE